MARIFARRSSEIPRHNLTALDSFESVQAVLEIPGPRYKVCQAGIILIYGFILGLNLTQAQRQNINLFKSK